MITIIVGKTEGMRICRALAKEGHWNKMTPIKDYTYELKTKAPREVLNAICKKDRQNNIKIKYPVQI